MSGDTSWSRGQQKGNSPHRIPTIPDELAPAKTALERTPTHSNAPSDQAYGTASRCDRRRTTPKVVGRRLVVPGSGQRQRSGIRADAQAATSSTSVTVALRSRLIGSGGSS